MNHMPPGRQEFDQIENPTILREQPGKVVFARAEPTIMYIRGEDGKVYVTNDKVAIDMYSEYHKRTRNRIIRFRGVVSGDSRCACFLEPGNDEDRVIMELSARNQVPVQQQYQDVETDDEWRPRSQSMQPIRLLPAEPSRRIPICPAPSSVHYAHRYPVANYDPQHEQIVYQFRQMATVANHVSPPTPQPSPSRVEEFWEKNDHEIEAMMDHLTDTQLHVLLNKWYRIPDKFNRETYPYPCEGFVVPNNDGKTIFIFTRRLGCIILPEDPKREGRSYAYFLVYGPSIYKAYEGITPPTFKSTKYVNTSNIEMKGYGLMAPGIRSDSESKWYIWNDQTGFMRCQSNCARVLKNKYSRWQPTCQIVMFDATSIDNGRNWIVKTISFVDYPTAERVYYIKNLRVLPDKQQQNPAQEVVFYSDFLKDHVFVKLAHILDQPSSIEEGSLFNAIVFPCWGNNGQSRRLHGLVAGSEPELRKITEPNFMTVAKLLEIEYWDKEAAQQSQPKIVEQLLPEPQTKQQSDDEWW